MKRYIILVFTIMAALPALAQSGTGFGLALDGDFRLAKGLHLGIDTEIRSQDGMSELERLSLGVGLSYKFSKYVKADAGYVLLFRHNPESLTDKGNTLEGYWSPRHRLYAGAKGELGLGRLTLSLRERFQHTHTSRVSIAKYSRKDGSYMEDKVKEAGDEYMLRSRLGLEYNISHCPVTPFVTVEMYNDLSGSMCIDQMRYAGGVSWKMDGHNSLELRYRYKDKGSDDDEPGSHLISLGYCHSF